AREADLGAGSGQHVPTRDRVRFVQAAEAVEQTAERQRLVAALGEDANDAGQLAAGLSINEPQLDRDALALWLGAEVSTDAKSQKTHCHKNRGSHSEPRLRLSVAVNANRCAAELQRTGEGQAASGCGF